MAREQSVRAKISFELGHSFETGPRGEDPQNRIILEALDAVFKRLQRRCIAVVQVVGLDRERARSGGGSQSITHGLHPPEIVAGRSFQPRRADTPGGLQQAQQRGDRLERHCARKRHAANGEYRPLRFRPRAQRV